MFGIVVALIALALIVALIVGHLYYITVRLEEALNDVPPASPAHVNAAIEDLRTALAQVNATNRREFGAIWKRLGLSRRPAAAETVEEEDPPPAANDDSFTAMLALQSTPPVKPS